MNRIEPTTSPELARVSRVGAGSWFEALTDAGDRLCLRGVAPDERVRLARRSGDPGWADLVETLEPSARRREPPCPLASRCGGCHWLHLEESLQSELRLGLVREALQRAGAGSAASDRLSLRRARAPLGFRCRARFQVAVDAAGRGRLGFHAAGSREVLDVPACPLLAPELARVHAALREHWARAAPAGLSGVELTALPGAPGALVLLNPRDRAPTGWPRCGEDLLAALPDLIAGVAVRSPARADSEGSAPAGTNTNTSASASAEILGARAVLGWSARGRPVAVGARSFVQADLETAEVLADELARLCEAASGPRLLELHAGSGFLSWRLAAAGSRVQAFESEPLAVEAGELLPEPPTGALELARGEARAVFESHVSAASGWPGGGADVLVTDPPREGLQGLAPVIAAGGPERLVGVWCSLEALTRDLRALLSTHRIEEVVALELFSQTRHVETLVALRRR